MKVYVMSEDKRHGIWFEAVMASEVWAAMTPIDIPDGCQLAVVENGPKPDFSVVKGANGVLHASGIALGQEAMWDNNYRRVVQVVGLL
jgi:hypothetical protein